MPTIQAQDIVNAAIQDSMNQTTNRTALYDYTDRVHQRILRESQWRFLLSDPKTFVTMPGISSYTLTNGTPPPGAFPTPLQLTDLANVAPGTVFNVTNFTRIEEDSDTQTTLNYVINKDGSLRQGIPRTYRNNLSSPGTLSLIPAPDSNNLYYPVPETPIVTITAGGSLPERIYWGVVTYVDSIGGESVACTIPFSILIPAGYLITVDSPLAPSYSITSQQISYTGWNVYIGYSQNGWMRQNTTSIAIGTNWTEGVLGINTGTLIIPSAILLPYDYSEYLGIYNTGQLTITPASGPVIPQFWALAAPNNTLWAVTYTGSGPLETVEIPANPSLINVFSQVYITDAQNISTWKIYVDNSGVLHSQVYSTPPSTIAINGQPPTTPSIQPLYGYVIQFRYYQVRNQIQNPTDVLQIPYAYKDIVVAGVNYLASVYMDRQENREPSAKTLLWKKDFDEGMSQIRRDLRINFRKTDFIAPDVVSQTTVGNQQGIPTMGW